MGESVLAGIYAQMSYDCVPDPKECWCRGSGWVHTDWDSLHECPFHYVGQPNNESPDYEWEMWFDNMNGNGQFMLIPENPEDFRHNQAENIRIHLLRVAYKQEQEDIPF